MLYTLYKRPVQLKGVFNKYTVYYKQSAVSERLTEKLISRPQTTICTIRPTYLGESEHSLCEL